MAQGALRSLRFLHRNIQKQQLSLERHLTFLGCVSPRNRKFIVGGNWKMNGSKSRISELCKRLNDAELDPTIDIVLACPAVYLTHTRNNLPQTIEVAAQNVFKCNDGAFTGEISPAMLADLGINWVVLGHSERRRLFHESNELIAEKMALATSKDFHVIICVGESAEDRYYKKTEQAIAKQMFPMALKVKDWSKVVVAYEPVWAIGTGNVPTLEEIQETHFFLRNWLSKTVSRDVSNKTRIVYGGSVSATNCREIGELHDVDGFLVGGASLKPEFVEIINYRMKKN